MWHWANRNFAVPFLFSEQFVICSNFALLLPAPSVAVSFGLITSAAAANTRRRVAGGANDNSALVINRNKTCFLVR